MAAGIRPPISIRRTNQFPGDALHPKKSQFPGDALDPKTGVPGAMPDPQHGSH